MSSIQPGKGTGQRTATGNRRPPSAKPKPGQGAGGRGPASGGGRPPGNRNTGRRPGQPLPAGRPPQRFSASTIAFVAVAVVVLVIVALVVVKVAGGSKSPATTTGYTDSPAPTPLVNEVTHVPASVFQAVGVPSTLIAPQVAKNQPPLTAAGKPEVLYIGAEYCPYCAAERWAMVVAFSRFGTFANLKETNSSPWDTDPGTATFSFHGSTFTSNVITFTPVEHETNDKNGAGTRTVLQALTTAQQSLWTKYSAQFGSQTGYPFIDIGNKVFVLGPAYNPSILAGLGQDAIAAKLTNPNDPVTQAIVGEANYLSAGICALTGQQPTSVCSAPATTEATQALKLS